MQGENQASYEEVFRSFLKVFRVPPRVVLRDRDQWMIAALTVAWPSTLQDDCIWHLSGNVNTNLHGLFTGHPERWAAFMDMWWRIAKETDTSAIATVDAECAALQTFLANNTLETAARTKGATWLAAMLSPERRKEWMARYTWAEFTAGCDATSRGEALTGAI